LKNSSAAKSAEPGKKNGVNSIFLEIKKQLIEKAVRN